MAPRDGVMVRIGRWRYSLPLATIGTGVLAAGGIAWRVGESAVAGFRADQAAMADRLKVAEAAVAEQAHRIDMQGAILTEIRAAIVRVDTRLAEVQVILMRGRP